VTQSLLHLIDVHKQYSRGSETIRVLRGIDFHVSEGEYVGLIGPSGSGKSTLLNLIAGLDRPTKGQVFLNGVDIAGLNEAEISQWRVHHIGFIFQFYHLIPVLSAYENVELPLLLFGLSRRRRRKQVLTALKLVGLNHRLSHRPGQMSGGEQQRVGIARALVTDPSVIVADEPTGDLDGHTSEEILDLLDLLQKRLEKTIILVTHDPRAASRAARLVRLDDGQLMAGDDSTIEAAFPGWQAAPA